MEPITKDDLEELMNEHGSRCVSIYLPTHRTLPEARQDPIRFKNLLREAETSLGKEGLRTSELHDFLKPVEAVLDDPLFWRYQGDGLAVFLANSFFKTFRLPLSFKELCVVTDHFHIKPLLRLFSSDEHFFILALSLNEVRLIEGTRYGAREIELENAPQSLAEILAGYDVEQQLQFHTRAQGVGGERAAVFHGQGGGVDDVKPRIVEYFRRIDRSVGVTLKDQQAPLLLAGVESLFPLYREANTYASLLEDGIAGNPEPLRAEELRKRGMETVEPVFLKAERDAIERYKALSGTGRTSNDLNEIIVSAHHGRVEVLFAPLGVEVWGRYDEKTGSVIVHDQVERSDRDLLDMSAVQTLLNRGSVYMVEPETVPSGGLLSAILRY